MSDETREAVCTWCDHSAQGTALHNDEGRYDSCGAPDHGLAGTFVRTVHDPPVEEIHDDRCRRQYANQIGVDTCDCWKRLPAPQAEGDVRGREEQIADVANDILVALNFEPGTRDAEHDAVADVVRRFLASGLVVPAAIHKVATDALEAGDACGAVGCRALIERDAALAELAQVTQWHDEVRQECAELRGGVGAIKAAALREASMALISGNGHELTIGATSRSHVAANARRWLRDRADAMTATTDDIGDGTSEGDQG